MPFEVVQAFRHKTEMGKERLCVRFSDRPDSVLITLLKAVDINARYRKGVKKGEPSLWYIPIEGLDLLSTRLAQTAQLPDGQIDKLSHAITPYTTQAFSSEDDDAAGSPVQSDVEEEAPVIRASRKRLRSRLPCKGCEYETRAAEMGLGFSQMYHSCDPDLE